METLFSALELNKFACKKGKDEAEKKKNPSIFYKKRIDDSIVRTVAALCERLLLNRENSLSVVLEVTEGGGLPVLVLGNLPPPDFIRENSEHIRATRCRHVLSGYF
ncbi:uncharacterized protein V6R79_005375 [Siganus canaliculatus]